MNALVLCAGFGTRLGRLCEALPKPLLPVGSRRLVEHTLRHLARHGVQRVWINVHYKAEQFEPALGDGSHYGLRIHYVHEAAPRGTAGTAGDVLSRLDADELLVHYGDVLTSHDLRGFVERHRRTPGAEARILVHQRPGSNSHVFFGDDGCVTGFLERPERAPKGNGPQWAFSGVCLLRRNVLRSIPLTPDPDLPRDVFPCLAERGALYAEPLRGDRCAVDSPERLALAGQLFSDRSPSNLPRSHT